MNLVQQAGQPSSPAAGTTMAEGFPWESSRALRFTPQGEYPLAFPPECPVRLHFFHFTVDHRLTPSYHDYLELALICDGQGCLVVEHQRYPVAPGDVLIIGSREFHLLQATHGQTLKAASLHFRPELIHAPGGSALDFEYLRPFHHRGDGFSHRIPRASLPEGLVLDRLTRIYQAIRAGGSAYPLAVKTYLNDILLELHRRQGDGRGPLVPRDRRVRDFERLREVLSHVRKNCPDPVSLRQVARMAHMSPNYFCRFFKAVTGHTLTEYVLRLRVDLAMEFLSSSAMSVTEIAYASGFSSHSYFDRVFKRLKGLTPVEYRRRLKI
jgi:AraC-like DNA-binding protein